MPGFKKGLVLLRAEAKNEKRHFKEERLLAMNWLMLAKMLAKMSSGNDEKYARCTHQCLRSSGCGV